MKLEIMKKLLFIFAFALIGCTAEEKGCFCKEEIWLYQYDEPLSRMGYDGQIKPCFEPYTRPYSIDTTFAGAYLLHKCED